MSSRIDVAIVIPIRDGKFLMVFNPSRGWEFPGGKVKDGENPNDTAIREAREETGVVLEDVEIIERMGNVAVYTGKIREFKGKGEFEYRLFESLPGPLAFGREEAKYLLKLAFEQYR